jgi:serine/threonine protein kinase
MALSKLTILNEQYVLRKMLGDHGQYDVTYLAWNLKKEHDAVIVREFNPSHLVSREADGVRLVPRSEPAQKLFEYGLNCFIREAAAASLIDHPNVVNQQAYFEENGTAYCVTDYHPGATLSTVLDGQDGMLPERAAFTIMMPLLDGLLAGHRKGLIHGRLSPQRIYLTKSGRPMLLRFHVTQILLARRCGRVDDMMVPGYTPPELLIPDGKKGPWSDVYASAERGLRRAIAIGGFAGRPLRLEPW